MNRQIDGNKVFDMQAEHTLERWYVNNITSDEIVGADDKEIASIKLHSIVCDVKYDIGPTEKQVCRIITEEQLESIRQHGYCDVVCSKDVKI